MLQNGEKKTLFEVNGLESGAFYKGGVYNIYVRTSIWFCCIKCLISLTETLL